MNQTRATEIHLIRHAPVAGSKVLAGRTDVAADLSDVARRDGVVRRCGDVERVISSPARRCRETAAALFGESAISAIDPRFWEQDFGAWDGAPLQTLPDLGRLSRAELATHRPPGGESFADLCARAAPALREAGDSGGRVAIVAHAGIVRAALALATGDVAGALAFAVAPWSVSRFVASESGAVWAIEDVNWTADARP